MARLARAIDFLHRLRRRWTERAGPPHGLLLISAGGLGDTVMFASVADRFATLAKNDEPVTVLLRKDGAKTAFCLPDGINVITVDFQRFGKSSSYRWQTMESIYQSNFRCVISTDFLRHPHLDEVLAMAAAAPESAAMEARHWTKYQSDLEANQRHFTQVFDSGPERYNKVLRWTDFANWLVDSNDPPPSLCSDRLKNRFSSPNDNSEIIIQPFSAVGAKQSPPAMYEPVIDRLRQHFRITITGTANDFEANPDFAKMLEKQNVEMDTSTFEEIAPRLADASLVISVDTAMMHLAVALGAPTICVASAAYVGEIVPYDDQTNPDNAHFIYHPMSCEGCLGSCVHPLIDGRFPCIDKLSADDLTAKADQLIQSSSKSRI